MVELTEREREVAELVAERMSYSAIAAQLDISPRTVEAHVSRIAEKIPGDGTPRLKVFEHAILRREGITGTAQ